MLGFDLLLISMKSISGLYNHCVNFLSLNPDIKMSKRQAETEPGGTEPPAKKIVFEPLQLGAINNIEELDLKTLQFQNRKLGQRLALKNKIEEELRARYLSSNGDSVRVIIQFQD